MVQSLKQNSIHGAELKQNSISGEKLKHRRQEKWPMKDEFYEPYLKKKNSTLLNKWMD